MIGLDTTALIDLYKSDESLLNVIEGIDNSFVSTIINYQEIFFGINESDKSYEEETNFYNSIFNNLFVYDLTKEISRKASKILWEIKKQRKDIGEFDCMIAGILLSNGVNKIITKNKKHFENIDGLRVISY